MRSNYIVVEDKIDVLCLVDVGPWSIHSTITNDAEIVVEELLTRLNGRRLEYIDSDGRRDQIIIEDGKFAGFGLSGIDYTKKL